MSDKPKIYGHCPAGCNWETVHKDEFLKSASIVRQYPDENGKIFLQRGKEYKIFCNQDDGEFLARVFLGDNNTDYKILALPINDKYADSFVLRFLDCYADENTKQHIVYDYAGVRYDDIIATTIYNTSTVTFYVRNTDTQGNEVRVCIYNADATIEAKGEKGDAGSKIERTEYLGTDENGGNMYKQYFEGGQTATFTAPKGDKGADGTKGEKGDKGDQGEKGNPFTYADFTAEQLAALKGRDGIDGTDGLNGMDGISVTHQWNGTKLVITSASGTSEMDLKGEKGDADGVSEARVIEIIREELNYKAIDITSFTNSVVVAEIGSTVSSVTLSWRTNKTPTSLTLDGASVDKSLTSKTVSGTFTANKSWSLKATDERGETDTASTTLYFEHPFYYGGSTASSISSVDGLTKTVKSSVGGTYGVTLSADGYVYFVIYGSISKITDAETGYGISYEQTGTITRTINSTSYAYKVYRSAQLVAGTYKLKVEV